MSRFRAISAPVFANGGDASATTVKATGSTTARTPADWFADVINVKAYGAKGDGTTDDTTAIQAAITAAQTSGGCVLLPAATYKIAGTLNVTGNNVRIVGAGRRATILNFANGASDCITVVGVSYASMCAGFQLENVQLSFASKTGGRTLAMQYCTRAVIRDVDVENCYTGFEIYGNNDAFIENVIFQGVGGGSGINFSAFGPASHMPTACYGIFWHGAADGTASAIQLTTVNVTVSANYSGADGFIWDGNASTWNMLQTTALNTRYGLWVKNSAASASNFPTFLNAVNFNTDGMLTGGVRIDGGSTFQFANCAINNTSGSSGQGSADTYAMQINADASHSVTREIYLVGCRIGLSKQSALYCAARDVLISSCKFISGTTTPSNTYPAIEVASPAQDINISNCQFSLYGAVNDWKYGVQVDSGTSRVSVSDNNIFAAGTRAILWNNSDSASQDFGNTVGVTGLVDPAPFMLPQSDTVTGAYTVGAAKLLGGIYVAGGTPGAGFTATTDTAANLVAALQSPVIGKGISVLVINASNGAMTLAPGTGVAMGGNTSGANFTIASGQSRLLILRFGNVTAGSESVAIYG
jgi:hypothetical protein